MQGLLETAVVLHTCEVFFNRASCPFNRVTDLDFENFIELFLSVYCKKILFYTCQDMIIEMFMNIYKNTMLTLTT